MADFQRLSQTRDHGDARDGGGRRHCCAPWRCGFSTGWQSSTAASCCCRCLPSPRNPLRGRSIVGSETADETRPCGDRRSGELPPRRGDSSSAIEHSTDKLRSTHGRPRVHSLNDDTPRNRTRVSDFDGGSSNHRDAQVGSWYVPAFNEPGPKSQLSVVQWTCCDLIGSSRYDPKRI
jgi:hypothetical protein